MYVMEPTSVSIQKTFSIAVDIGVLCLIPIVIYYSRKIVKILEDIRMMTNRSESVLYNVDVGSRDYWECSACGYRNELNAKSCISCGNSK